MKKDLTSRDSLIQEGLGAFLARGYDGVGLEEILKARGVPKGSFYHFFSSKEDFACAVVEAYSAHYSQLRAKLFADEKYSPSMRLRRYFKVLEREVTHSGLAGGCLLGVLAQTAGSRRPKLVKRLAQSFEEWEQSLSSVILKGQKAGEIALERNPRECAALLIDAYEGALVRVKADENMRAFSRFKTGALGPLLNSGLQQKISGKISV